MIGCLWTHVCKQPIIALYFESENELKFYNLEALVRKYNDNETAGRLEEVNDAFLYSTRLEISKLKS